MNSVPFVILSAAKDLARRQARFFAALRMTLISRTNHFIFHSSYAVSIPRISRNCLLCTIVSIATSIL